jgi:hypothetical protein
MDQETGIGSLYDEIFRSYGAGIRPFCPDFRLDSTHKQSYPPRSQARVATADFDASAGGQAPTAQGFP